MTRALGLAAVSALAAACADEPTVPFGPEAEMPGTAASFAVHLTCTVDVAGGSMRCDPSSPAGVAGGPRMNLIVGSQHRFVRMANDAPSVSDGVWSANVTVQNLTLQPFGTLDGENADAAGVWVFFVDEPNNGVEVSNHDGEATFTGSEPQKYYEYSGALLGGDEVLAPGERSGAKTWRFALNGATEFQFSVLVWTTVQDPGAYSVRLTRISVGGSHTCGDGSDDKIYCWGDNFYGQHGDGTYGSQTTPVAAQAPEGVRLSGVSAGLKHTCALSTAGPAYCWGYNKYGQLGDGRTTNSLLPVIVAGTR